MSADLLKGEIAGLMKRALFLDIAAYLISTAFYGFTLSFAAGLCLGTAVLLGTLVLLAYSVTRMEQDAKRAGVTNQRRYLLLYALRLLIFGIAFGAALLLRKRVSPVAVCIPMLYPRLIYTAGALFQKPGKKR